MKKTKSALCKLAVFAASAAMVAGAHAQSAVSALGDAAEDAAAEATVGATAAIPLVGALLGLWVGVKAWKRIRSAA